MSNVRAGKATDLYAYTSIGQAIYYVLTGVWAIVSVGTFQKVTGPKVDVWLVKTVGALVIVIGVVLGMFGRRRHVAPEAPMLAIGSALGLAAIDLIYVAKKRISPIYLLDAAGELFFVGLWALALRTQPSSGKAEN